MVVTGLDALLEPLPAVIAQHAHAIINMIADTHPELEAKVKQGWRSVNFRHPQAGHVCALFPERSVIKLYFEHGVLLSDPENCLKGQTRQTRYMLFEPPAPIDGPVLAHYIAEAIALKV